MHEKEVKSILSAQNGMNIYRGCTHGCIYCDARSTCYQIQHDFEDIEVKSNAVELLEKALRSKRKKCMIGTGAMSDPYLPIENKLQLTRQCLELIDEYGFGLAIQTKSDLILRDLDLLRSINKKSKCVVQMTLTTYDEELCKILEPNVCTTKRRAEVLNIMKEEGISTVCWMTPILPFINDTEENIRGILDYCIKAKVYGILFFHIGVTLRDGDRQYFYQKLEEHFPGMKEKYRKTYGNDYEIFSPNNKNLADLVRRECRKQRIVCGTKQLFDYMHLYEDKQAGVQLSLFDL
ncbi:SPL family radical SAM protein [Anaerocolumna xylanovorans]|uniref:DNA repair photolyase n=1 Tax=Anaerocolumna xylanovorans DSM 12503 TaxID=1121345 RepID=A0A1M7Y7K6_9FIRM|nr:radical SAM protein [Anaerocolumna xylanovorans]SHO48614.1 DNA repair photolyase [Anaerocolumna xylanovorans DSM 12503]